jgi:integrase
MAKIVIPDGGAISMLGFPSVAHVPVIFDSLGCYCRALNRYLRERATGDWFPEGGRPFPSPSTLLKIAEDLKNFLEWGEKRGISFERATYDQVLQYQRDQMAGRWSLTGAGLQPSTANQRADDVTLFLAWAALRGLRAAFDVKRFFARSPGGETKMVRAGRAKESGTSSAAKRFVLPTPAEVRDWLARVRLQKGYAKYLAARFILEVGPRRMEVEALEVEQWPSLEAIRESEMHSRATVPMDLFVTKGGRPRTVDVPVRFAAQVREWIDAKRGTYEYRNFVDSGRKKRTRRLFLSDHPHAHGRPISVTTIYRIFKQVVPRPKLWSPHKGRHVFACFFVLNALELEARPHGGLDAMQTGWIESRGQFWLMILRDQFGHMSKSTTEMYLRWLVSSCKLAELASGWHLFLEGNREHSDADI